MANKLAYNLNFKIDIIKLITIVNSNVIKRKTIAES